MQESASRRTLFRNDFAVSRTSILYQKKKSCVYSNVDPRVTKATKYNIIIIILLLVIL